MKTSLEAKLQRERDRKREKRASLTEEELALRRQKDAERKRLLRAQLSDEKVVPSLCHEEPTRLVRECRLKVKEEVQSEEQSEEESDGNENWQSISIANKFEIKRIKHVEHQRERRANRTEEEKEIQRVENAARQRERRRKLREGVESEVESDGNENRQSTSIANELEIKRIKHAAFQRERRANLTEEEKAIQRVEHAARQRERRRKLREEELELQEESGRKINRRSKSKPSKLAIERTKHAALQRERRAKLSEEEKAIRRKRDAARKRELRAQLNEEQRALFRMEQAAQKRMKKLSDAQLILNRKLDKRRKDTKKKGETESTLILPTQLSVVQEQENLAGETPDDKETLLKIQRLKILVASLKDGGVELVKSVVASTVHRLKGGKGLPKKAPVKRKLCKLDENGRKVYQNRKADLNQQKTMYPVVPVGHNNFVCIVCNEELDTLRGIKTHLGYHMAPELFGAKEKYEQTIGGDAKKKTVFLTVYDCEVCSDKCCSLITYRKHLLEKHKENKELLKKVCFPCTLCEETFITKMALNSHQKYLHNIFARCPVCSESFDTQEPFVKHVEEKHVDSDKNGEMILEYFEGYFCKLCGLCSGKYNYITTHLKEAHSDNISFECDVCQVKFSTKRSLHRHNNSFHQEKPFCCEHCGERFIKSIGLRMHKRKHTANSAAGVQIEDKDDKALGSMRAYNQKQRQCNVCGKNFPNRSVLRRHKTLLCEKDKVNPSPPCSICGMVLDNYILLQHHKYHVHKHETTGKTSRNRTNILGRKKHQKLVLPCSFCGKILGSKTKLLAHWRLHREETPFKCSSCRSVFKCTYKFYRHQEKTHENEDKVQMITDTDADEKLKADFNEAHADLFLKYSEANQPVERTPRAESNINPVNLSLNQHSDSSFNEVIHNLFGDVGVDNRTGRNNADKHYVDFSRANVPARPETVEDPEANCGSHGSTSGENVTKTSGLIQGNENVIVENGRKESNDNTDKSYIDFSRANVPVASKAPQETAKDNSDEPGSTSEANIATTSSISQENEEATVEDDLMDSYDDLWEPVELSSPIDSPLPEPDMVIPDSNSKEDKKPFIYGKESDVKDPFPKRLTVKIERLKECLLCDEFFSSSYLYKKHLNTKGHRLALRSNKRETILIKREKKMKDRIKIRIKIRKDKERKKDRKVIRKGKCGRRKQEALFPCPFCGEKIDGFTEYKKHTAEHKKKVNCAICSEKFTGVAKLVDHYNAEHNGENVVCKCDICGMGFLDSKARGDHLRVHNKRRVAKPYKGFSCEVCGEKIKGTTAFRDHILSHGDFKHKCVHCEAEFKTLMDFDKHYKEVHNGDMPFLCKKCPKKFVTQLKLEQHESYCKEIKNEANNKSSAANKEKRKSQYINKEQHLCSVCSATFWSLTKFKTHMIQHNQRAMCLLCPEGFPYVRRLVDHYLTVHNGEKLIRCEICDIPFLEYQPRNLREHMADRHDQEVGKIYRGLIQYPCEVCGVISEGKKLYKSHVLSHKKEKHKCKQCNLELKGLDALENHYNETHNGEMPFPCEECPLKFSILRRLQLHQKEAHPNSVNCQDNNELSYHKTIQDALEETEKVFCEVCGKLFFGEASLTIHKREHTGEKPYQCTVCGKAFFSPALLKQHMNKDHKKNCHPCDACGKSFNRRKTLLKHYQSYHTDTFQRDLTCQVCSFRCNKPESLDIHMKYHDPARRFVCEICSWRFKYSSNLCHHRKVHATVEESYVRSGRAPRSAQDFSQIIRPVPV